MPSTLEALAIFALAIAPGYGFISGYQHQRSHSTPERDLHVLAQAIIVSAIWVAITWWPAGHLLTKWTTDGSLGEHELQAWLLACGLLGLPYHLGRLLGLALRGVEGGKPRWLFKTLSFLGAFEAPSLWDWTWEKARQRGPVIVVIRLKDGGLVEGQFASGSKAELSPRPPRLFLEKAYGYDQEGQRIVFPRGAYLEGSEIASVTFRT
jgi:Family of unknown function (DUF6338)